MHEAGRRIAEVPIPTYYGDEICYVDGVKYAKDVTRDVLRYRAHKMGFGSGELAFKDEGYALKYGDGSSHSRILGRMEQGPDRRGRARGFSDGTRTTLRWG